MFVGGEFYEDSFWLRDKPTVSTDSQTFLNGGKACLLVIGAALLDHGIHKILLPSYLCPSIVNPLEQCGLSCEYYKIKADFSIDLDDLAEKALNHQAVYFINYFGFLIPQPDREFLTGLRHRGVWIVEDNAQGGFTDQCTGDFVFNSMRKLTAHDGGYLTSPFDARPYVQNYQGQVNRRLPLIRRYRSQLADYLFQGKGSHDELTRLYSLAEAYYESDLVVEGDAQEREQIERLDWQGIKQVRRENYAYLLGLIAGIPEITPIFPSLQPETMPLGLPVYVSGVPRDWLFDELGKAGIGLTIHWDELIADPRLNGNPVAVDMAGRILTLVIDQRTSHKQLDYMVGKLSELLKKAKTDPSLALPISSKWRGK
jgi:dTDP-4-amino-4,6-dideoxygalactose transaminase